MDDDEKIGIEILFVKSIGVDGLLLMIFIDFVGNVVYIYFYK